MKLTLIAASLLGSGMLSHWKADQALHAQTSVGVPGVPPAFQVRALGMLGHSRLRRAQNAAQPLTHAYRRALGLIPGHAPDPDKPKPAAGRHLGSTLVSAAIKRALSAPVRRKVIPIQPVG